MTRFAGWQCQLTQISFESIAYFGQSNFYPNNHWLTDMQYNHVYITLNVSYAFMI